MSNWIRNPKAPSSLWDGLVLDGAYAGLHPGTNRFVDGSGLENHGVLTNMDASTDWVWSDDLGRWALDFDGSNDHTLHTIPFIAPPFSICCFLRNRLTAADGFYRSALSRGSVFSENTNFAVGQRWSKQDGSKRLYCYWTSGATIYGAETAGGFAENVWTHSAAIIDQNSNLTLYASGVLLSTDTANNAPADGGQSVRIGGPSATPSSDRYYLGLSSDQLIHRRILAPEEITWLADRSNRMYVPDTRRAIWVPTPFNPALMRRRRRMAGAR